MLGHYENFPETIHGFARFACRSSIRKVQQAILCALNGLNKEFCGLNAITPHLKSECEVSFEFGAAEEIAFNYLDKEELDRFQKSIVKKALPILDFFCVVRYHVVNKKGKRVALKFDYHLLRFVFYNSDFELRVSHERGTQRIPLEDLLTFITNRINEELSQRQLKPLNLKYLRTL